MVFGLEHVGTYVRSQQFNGYNWLHVGDYAELENALAQRGHQYAIRIVKCDSMFRDGVFLGIRGTNL